MHIKQFTIYFILFCLHYTHGQNFYQYYKKVKYYYHQLENKQNYIGLIQPRIKMNKDKNFRIKSSKSLSDSISSVQSNSDSSISNRVNLAEGSFCRRSADGRSGYCMPAHKCLHVVHEFRKYGTKLDICSYDRDIPIVCCPLQEKDISTRSIVKKRVSAIKCDEYNGLSSTYKHDSYPRYKKTLNLTKCEGSIPLIVGGEITYPGEFPHMAAVGWKMTKTEIKWACGGTLISEKYVLTAAHCTHLGGKQPNIVRLGEHNIRQVDMNNYQEYDIENVIVYPKYKSTSLYHDIALLKLNRNVIFTKYIHPACLWQKSNINIDFGIAIGWGRKQFLGPKSDQLRKVDLKIIEQNLCNKLYMNENKLPKGIMNDYQFCAGHLEGGKDTCQGDSGGPLQTTVIDKKCIHYVVGVTSFGKVCATPNAPGVYTKVYAYIDWIESIVFNSSN